jgi:hypothetical protein
LYVISNVSFLTIAAPRPVKDCVPKSKLGNCSCQAFGKFQTLICNPELLAGELEFDGQALHVELAAAPTAAEYVPAPQSVQVAVPVAVPSSSTIQEATKPDETTLPSDVNLTCMYPVLDV